MAFEHYVRSGDRMLRCGYTTGTCAALAARGAAELLLGGTAPAEIELLTPKGLTVQVAPVLCRLEEGAAVCGVRKDAGDDPDITDGAVIVARVCRSAKPGIRIDGGEGVGRVTRPGLDQPVGEAAINHVPRQMISREIQDVCEAFDYTGGLSIEISVPDGAERAAKTFNPVLGVEGGISILGTSGIVEHMSEQAWIDTLNVQIRQAAAEGKRRLILTPGNYGMDFLKNTDWQAPVVKISNFLGEALDAAKVNGFKEVLLTGHIGKLVKVAGGIMNTHSKMADCRRELFTAHAAICGASTEVCRSLMEADTTDACIAVLKEAGLEQPVMDSLVQAIQQGLNRRVKGEYLCGAVVFSNVYGELGRTENAEEILKKWQN